MSVGTWDFNSQAGLSFLLVVMNGGVNIQCRTPIACEILHLILAETCSETKNVGKFLIYINTVTRVAVEAMTLVLGHLALVTTSSNSLHSLWSTSFWAMSVLGDF